MKGYNELSDLFKDLEGCNMAVNLCESMFDNGKLSRQSAERYIKAAQKRINSITQRIEKLQQQKTAQIEAEMYKEVDLFKLVQPIIFN